MGTPYIKVYLKPLEKAALLEELKQLNLSPRQLLNIGLMQARYLDDKQKKMRAENDK